jgi:hypothetical protein
MSDAFVWFQNSSEQPRDSVAFYEKLLGWQKSAGPPGMTLLASAAGPFAGVAARQGGVTGWIPYVQVDDVDEATLQVKKLGASLLQERSRGPAGEFTVIRDPGGATLALWQKL